MEKNHDDKELLNLFKKEETQHYAFQLMVRKYQETIYRHIRKIVLTHENADDVMQNTFIKVWEGLPHFREESKLYTWIYRIATNEALNYLKKMQKKRFFPMHTAKDELINQLKSDPYFNGEELQIKLQKALLTLPEKQRIVFNMKYFDDMKYKDMAEILETSEGALKASYHHAVKKIQEYLTKD